MSTRTESATQAAIGAAARNLLLPTVRDEATRLAEIAARERQLEANMGRDLGGVVGGR
jgi:hypothetical protein